MWLASMAFALEFCWRLGNLTPNPNLNLAHHSEVTGMCMQDAGHLKIFKIWHNKPLTALMRNCQMWFVFSFQLVQHFVGGPDVPTCLFFPRLPHLQWPNMPNKDDTQQVPRHVHERDARTRICCYVTHAHPRFLHAYKSAGSTNRSKDNTVRKLLTRGVRHVSRTRGVKKKKSSDFGRRFKSLPEQGAAERRTFCRAFFFLSDALILRRRQLITAGV